MFSVYAEKAGSRKTIYNDTWLRVGEYNAGTVMFNPVLHLEDSQAGSFSFSIPPTNQGYDFIERFTTEIIVYRIKKNTSGEAITETEIFRGRVIDESGDFSHNRSFVCEGDLNYLKDTIQPQKKYLRTMSPQNYFQNLINIHNSKVEKKKRFYIDTCQFSEWRTDIEQSSSDSEDNKYRETRYEDTLSCIFNAFEDLKNPHLQLRWGNKTINGVSTRVRFIDFLKDSRDGGAWGATVLNDQEVLMGQNITDFSKSYDISNICSVIIPIGAQIENAEEKAHIGAPVQFNIMTGVLDENGYYSSEVTDPYFRTSDRISVSAGSKYYYTGRQWNGYYMYAWYDANDEFIQDGSYKSAAADYQDTDGRATDLIEQLIEAPSGATGLRISGGKDEITLRLNSYIENPETIEEYVTVSDIVDTSAGRKKKKGTIYVKDNSLLKKYGWIERVVEFPGVKTPQLLYNKAIKYLQEDVYENLIFEVKAIDMNNFDNTITPYSIGKSVHVFVKDETLDKNFPISKLDIYLDNPQNSLVTLGYQSKLNISTASSRSSANIYKKIKETTTAFSSNLKEAIDNATYLIKNGMTGFVNLVRDPQDNDVIREIVISSMADMYNPNAHIWRWNSGGLGYSEHGYNSLEEEYRLAMTNDGQIVADRITTGEMTAERVRGGTFKVGVVTENQSHQSTKESQIECYAIVDLYGGGRGLRKIGQWDKDGLSVYYTDKDTGWDTLTGMTNGEVRGYYKDDDYWVRAGTLNLVQRNQHDQIINGNVSLKAEDGGVLINSAGGDGQGITTLRASDAVRIQLGQGQNVANVVSWDYDGIHAGLDVGPTTAFHANVSGVGDCVFHVKNGIIYQVDGI